MREYRDSDVIRYTLYLIVFALICNKTLWLAAEAAAATYQIRPVLVPRGVCKTKGNNDQDKTDSGAYHTRTEPSRGHAEHCTAWNGVAKRGEAW